MTQTGDNGMSVDWSRPIEAVHDDGRVVPVIIMSGPDSDGDYGVTPAPDGTHNCFRADGSKWVGGYIHGDTGWRIRNVTQPAPTPDELTKRMEALVRDMATLVGGATYSQLQTEARAIVAMLPEPVDPDEAEARDLVRMAYPDMKDDYQGRRLDIALAAIKRGRALERGEG